MRIVMEMFFPHIKICFDFFCKRQRLQCMPPLVERSVSMETWWSILKCWIKSKNKNDRHWTELLWLHLLILMYVQCGDFYTENDCRYCCFAFSSYITKDGGKFQHIIYNEKQIKTMKEINEKKKTRNGIQNKTAYWCKQNIISSLTKICERIVINEWIFECLNIWHRPILGKVVCCFGPKTRQYLKKKSQQHGVPRDSRFKSNSWSSSTAPGSRSMS